MCPFDFHGTLRMKYLKCDSSLWLIGTQKKKLSIKMRFVVQVSIWGLNLIFSPIFMSRNRYISLYIRIEILFSSRHKFTNYSQQSLRLNQKVINSIVIYLINIVFFLFCICINAITFQLFPMLFQKDNTIKLYQHEGY